MVKFIYRSENKVSGINLVCFFEDLLEDFIDERKSKDNTSEQLKHDALLGVVCPKCKGEMLPQDDKVCIDCWQKYYNQ
ncbi:unnamed protein product [marine sediment metagenome]|uniref:Uncharacterized protein n=1 Tax=marine sediment metagenome TaxID=412755 RepID=X1TET9_9ZZZZ